MSTDRNQPSADQDTRGDDRFDDLLHVRLLADNEHPDDDDLDDDETQVFDADDAADLALMREALGNYKSETLRFAAEQSAAMPAPRVSRAAALWDGTPRWAVAATAAVALACTTVYATHRANKPAPVAMAAAPTTQALQADNTLLLSVDQALNTSVAPNEEDLGLTTPPAHTAQHRRLTN